MKQVMNCHKDNGLLNMIRRTDPMITINELICLSNMENINAVLINDGMPQGERLVKLNQIAIQQMQVLEGNSGRNLLK